MQTGAHGPRGHVRGAHFPTQLRLFPDAEDPSGGQRLDTHFLTDFVCQEIQSTCPATLQA